MINFVSAFVGGSLDEKPIVLNARNQHYPNCTLKTIKKFEMSHIVVYHFENEDHSRQRQLYVSHNNKPYKIVAYRKARKSKPNRNEFSDDEVYVDIVGLEENDTVYNCIIHLRNKIPVPNHLLNADSD